MYDRTRYIIVKNELRTLTRNLRVNFKMNMALSIKNKPTHFWSYVRSKIKSKSKIPPLNKPDCTKAFDAKDKAETLNSFFSSIFTTEVMDNIPITNDIFLGDFLNSFIISQQMVYNKLINLNSGKSPGPDGWHPCLLKEMSDLIDNPLSMLFQKSLNEGVLPIQWLEACITAIYKKGLKDIVGNYRPVSLASVICKVMELIVRDEVVDHRNRNNLLSNDQHGFVPRRNCVTNLLTCIEIWTRMVEDGESIDIIYTDFAKAFDSVPHQRLLEKVRNFGITGNVHNWIKSFLSARKQRVCVEAELSSWACVKSGIPQGSVLGPTLFVIFINDMSNIVRSVCVCLLFADDAMIFRSIKTSSDNNILQEDLDAVINWSTRWQLPFNETKFKSLHIGKKNHCQTYKMNGYTLVNIQQWLLKKQIEY